MKTYRPPIFAIYFIIAVAALGFICCYNIYFSVNKSTESVSELNVS